MEERDRALGALARGGVDQLDPVDRQPGQRLGQVRDLEADVVEALPLGLEEARDAGRLVSRADQLDLRFADRQERDPDAVGRDGQDRLELEAQDVPVEAERALEVADDDRDVMDPAEPVRRELRAGRSIRRPPSLRP